MINYISNLAARAALRIAAVVFASLLSVPVFAADFTDGDFTFSANSDGTTCTVTGTTLETGDLNIPATATDHASGTTYSVTAIGDNAFERCSSFTGTLTLPNSLQTIGEWAFTDCSGFTGSLTIPNSVQTIGRNAFSGCSGFTGSLTLPNSLKTVSISTFSRCSGFTGTLTIPETVTSIQNSAFYGCSGFTGNLTLPNSLQTIGEWAFTNCSGFTGTLTIPNSVQSIGQYAFDECSGFNGSLTIGNSVEVIGERAFGNCSGFTGSLTIPNSVVTIVSNAFYNCSGFTGSLTIGNSVKVIGDFAFYGCSGFTGALTIGNSVQTIWNGAFRNCSGFTGSLTIPNFVTKIESYAFAGCSGFDGTLTIGNSVREICDNAFENCENFTGALTIPQSVQEIGKQSFAGCNSFSSLILYRKNGGSIGVGAFQCSGLRSITCFSVTPPYCMIGSSGEVFGGNLYSIPLYVPEESINSYIAANEWKKFSTIKPLIFDVDGITLNKTALELTVGESEILTATLAPEGASVTVVWSVDNAGKGIASVDQNGKVTALGAGSTTITATAGNVSTTCKVTVKSAVASGISLNTTSMTLVVGQSEKLTATITPDNAADKSVTWTSSSENVATVDANGNVTGIASGTATITATTSNGLKATCAVTVKAKVIDVASITLNMDKAELVEGSTTQLTATITPDNATDKSVTWSSSDEAVATVNADGLVTAVAPGTATITATTSNGLKATCAVTVKAKVIDVASITLNMDQAELVEGTTAQLIATVSPDNATDKSVTWSSSDEVVATVDANGLVTGVAAGSATITATTANGLKATCAVTVTAKQSGIEGVEGDSAGVRVDGNAIIAPEGSKVYDLSGREVTPSALTPGIYIVRIPGGRAVKVKV